MCDYSLCGLPTRLAAEGEELVVHRFRTGSIGLASPADLDAGKRAMAARSFWNRFRDFLSLSDSCPAPAVCVPPGAQLLLKDVPEDLQRQCGIGAETSAFFVQTSAEVNGYRDAVSFPNGAPVLLQSLREGMSVTVLSLGDKSVDNDRELAQPAF